MADSQSLVGKTVSHYRVLEKLGGGGMGIVYKAENTQLGRFLALKFLPDDFLRSSHVYEQWIRTYPRDTIPYDNVSLAYRSVGQHEKALNVASGAMRLDPRIP